MSDRECVTCGEPVDIVGLVAHECEEVLGAENLTRRERNTLMYVESRVVDHAGRLNPAQMNHEDQQNLKPLQVADLLDVRDGWVHEFTDRAWDIARDCRQLRAAQDIDPEKVGVDA